MTSLASTVFGSCIMICPLTGVLGASAGFCCGGVVCATAAAKLSDSAKAATPAPVLSDMSIPPELVCARPMWDCPYGTVRLAAKRRADAKVAHVRVKHDAAPQRRQNAADPRQP